LRRKRDEVRNISIQPETPNKPEGLPCLSKICKNKTAARMRLIREIQMHAAKEK
jgi:hypothetical protein